MEIELVKSPFDYKKFFHVLRYDKDISNNDAEIFALKICKELKKKTTVYWFINTCVGGKCTIETKVINDRSKRKRLKGTTVTVSDSPVFK
jgi:hypothetical protein